MKRVLLALALLPLFSHPVRAEDPVYFADPNFKAIVEAKLWVADPTPADMLALTELICIDSGIADLTGIEHAANLQKLWLRLNGFGDISPLSGLSNLRTLHLSINQISDISPLSGMSDLEYLDLHGNQITDISPLSGLSSLQKLILHRNQISDMSDLAGLSNLQYLDIQRNLLSDVSPLSNLSNLETLILEYNQISDISALSQLTSLEYLDVRENPLNEEAYNVHLPSITARNPNAWVRYDPGLGYWLRISSTSGGVVTDPGEGGFFCGEGEVVFLEATAKPGFVFANWSGSNWTTENPTSITVNQDCYVRAVFQSALDVIYVEDSAEDSEPHDPEENGTPEHPFDSIQEAIEVAADDVSIVVRPGTYCENIDFLGKRIRLLGIDPNDPNVSPLPVIDGAGTGPVVSMVRGEDENCVVMGFVITRGNGNSAGAVSCRGSSPVIANCLIVGNRTTFSSEAAVSCIDSQALFANCTIADNYGGEDGAGLRLNNSQVTVSNSILWGNTPVEILVDDSSELLITYSDLTGGWPGEGNIDADPMFAQRGYWADTKDPDATADPSDSDAIWIDGDYHLQSRAGRWDPQLRTWVRDPATSPCIDAGDPVNPVGSELSPNGGVINLGVHGGSTHAAKSESGL